MKTYISTGEDNNFIYKSLIIFCKKAVEELNNSNKRDVTQTIKNMDYNNWENNPHCLLYRIYKKDDFSNGNGMLCIVHDGPTIVSVSGASKYNDDIALIARRQYSLNDYKMKGIFQEYCMDYQVNWAKDKGFKACAILVNEYNKTLYKLLKRVSEGKSGAAGEPPFYKYRAFIPLGGPYKIKGASQYVMLHKFDENFNERTILWDH